MVLIDSSYQLNNILIKDCKKIETLDINFLLTWTNIKKIEKMENLKNFSITGYLNRNSVSHLSADHILDVLIKNCKNLEDILFYYYTIDIIPTNIHKLRKLNKLSLINCKLKNIPSFISKLNLIRLELSNNLIKYIPNEIYNMTCLKKLQLDNNRLTVIGDNINKLINLRSLSLQYNDFIYVSENIYSMNLFELFIDNIDEDKIFNLSNITRCRVYKSNTKCIVKNDTMLIFEDCKEIIRNFNPDIKKIKFLNCDSQINFGIFPVHVNNLPIHLETIELNLDVNYFIYKFSNLPSTTRTIKLNTMFYDTVYNYLLEDPFYDIQYNKFIKSLNRIPYGCDIYINDINKY